MALLLPGVVFSNTPETGIPNRLLARDAFHYLDLSTEQARTLNTLQASWQSYLAMAGVRAKELETRQALDAKRTPPDAAQSNRSDAELTVVCEKSKARQQQLLQESRAILTPPQLSKLAALEEAYALMPIVQSAQAAGLMPGAMTGPPSGMPGGKLEVEFTYVRASQPPLPGCRPATQSIRSGPAPAQQGKPAVP